MVDSTLTGSAVIAGVLIPGHDGSHHAVNPATGEQLEPSYTHVGASEVAAAALAAQDAFTEFRSVSPERRADLLEDIADRLESIDEEILTRAEQETALPRVRLEGELGRTTGQLRMFARELRDGRWLGVRFDAASDTNPDLRLRKVAIGPVAVFGASNFPLAFSTAGGDTASALAAGCPVVVKAHEAHPGTAELAGQCITDAVRATGLPAGTFSQLHGPGPSVGQALAAHPATKAIGFTGSRAAGTALMRTAAQRPEPIPVYAEMSSINPVVILPNAAEYKLAEIAEGYVGALTLGSGQFCTNPGLLFVPESAQSLVDDIAQRIIGSSGQTMLTSAIGKAYAAGRKRLASLCGSLLAEGRPGATENAPAPAVTRISAKSLRENPDLQNEVFGAAGLVVTYCDAEELLKTLRSLEGQLTFTVWAVDADVPLARQVLPLAETLAGRVIYNGWPTGVAVTDAMVHGGPFPATSDGRSTSVGTLAIDRFLRPVAYQNVPSSLLPSALQADETGG